MKVIEIDLIKTAEPKLLPPQFTGIAKYFYFLDDEKLPYSEEWYQDGRFHRMDGPALQNFYYDKIEWYLDGFKYCKQDYIEIVLEKGTEEEINHILWNLDKWV